MIELVNKKRLGQTISAPSKSRTAGNVVDLMDALKQSLSGRSAPPAKPKKGRKAATGQREMLLPIAGKKEASSDRKKADKPSRSTARTRKAS